MSSAYRLTVKFAPSGAAYFNDKTQKWETSTWGHVWLEARKPNESLDEKPSFSSGWSTGRSTKTAKDNISPDDWKNYRSSKGNLISSITVDITKDQFDKIQNYENAVREEKIPGFGKNYHAVWDSCIDFSGKGLGFIGLADKDFDGTALEWDRPDRQIKPFLDQIVKHKSKDASVTVSFRGKDYTLGHNESVDKFWDRIAPFWYLENMMVQENGQQNNQYSQLHSLKIEDMPQYAQNIYHQGKECFVDFCRHENIPYREEDLDRIGMSMAAAGYAQGLRGVSLIDVDERTREISIAHESPDLNEAVVNMDKAAELPQDNKDLQHQCLLLMDEFTSIGRVEIIAHSVSYMAGYNIRLFPIIQSVAQLDAVYGKEYARTIITNHALQIIYTPREQQDANAAYRKAKSAAH